MKKILLFFFILIHGGIVLSQDVASPTPNLQAVPGGSYIIAMDNTWQTNDDVSAARRFFNLKSYGLIVHLLNNNIKVKRIIRTGKLKDEADFSAPSVMIRPTEETVETIRDFKAGPFVVLAKDALNVDILRLIDNYNNNAGGISGITNSKYKVKVYKTTNAVFDVDVRHDLTDFIPKACILDDGGNADIHRNYMVLAGIPVTNYSIAVNTNLSVNCYTFASEPHNGNPDPSVVTNIKNFILEGGNFLAQCEAVDNYEALGKFHSTNGFVVTNSNPSVVSYPNADLGYSQFEGAFGIRKGGSVQNWRLATGSFYQNYTSSVATGPSNIPVGASVSKVLPLGSVGGLVFYLGSHSYSSITDYNEINGMRMYMNAFLTPAYSYNSMRHAYQMNCGDNTLQLGTSGGPPVSYPVNYTLYADNGGNVGTIDGGDAYVGAATISSSGQLNSIYVSPSFSSATPYLLYIQPSIGCYPAITVSPTNCFFAVLPAYIKTFTATRLNSNNVEVRWETLTEEQTRGFNIKRKNSSDQWEQVAFIPGKGMNTGSGYYYNDHNSFDGISQYQIEEVANDGQKRLSEIRSVMNGAATFVVYPNPAEGGKINIVSKDNSLRNIAVYDMLGKKVMSRESASTLTVLQGLRSGVYNLVISNSLGTVLHREKILVK